MRIALAGIIAPIPTIFQAGSEDVDPAAIAANVSRLMASPLAGILALGSNGEAAFLSEDESDRVVAAVREVVPSDRLLLAGVGRESTRATVVAARRAASLGADAVLVRTPFFFRSQMTPSALAAHFTAVADGSPVPVVLYNLPGVTGFSFTQALVERMADHPNAIGLKETSSDLDRLGQFAAVRPDRFAVVTGWAPVLYPALCAGATGGILAVANVFPEACAAIVRCVGDGRHDEALGLQRRLVRIAQLVSTVHGVAGLKAALDARGARGGPVRAPLTPLSRADRDQVVLEAARFQSWFDACDPQAARV